MQQVFLTLLCLSFGGTLFSGIWLLLEPLLRPRVSKAFAYYVWLLVLLRFCLPFGFVWHLLPNDWSVSQFTPSPDLATYTLVELYGNPDNVENIPLPSQTDGAALTGPAVMGQSLTDQEKTGFWAVVKDPKWWVCLWLLGFGISLGRKIWLSFSFGRRLQKTLLPVDMADAQLFSTFSQSKKVDLCCSSAIQSPLLFGLFRPCLVLPAFSYVAQGKTEELRQIFQHELTHYQRGDLVYHWFVLLTSSLHWFNPVFPFLQKKIAQARELACDEGVLRHLGQEQRQQYGEMLLNYGAKAPLASKTAKVTLAEDKERLKERLLAIRSYHPFSHQAKVFMGVLALCFCLLASVMLGEANLGEPYPKPSTAQEAMDCLAESLWVELTGTEAHSQTTLHFLLPDYAQIEDFSITISALSSLGEEETWFTEYHGLFQPGEYTFCPVDGQGYSQIIFFSTLPGAEDFSLDLSLLTP